MSRHLLDSNILIGFLRHQEQSTEILRSLSPFEVPACSTLSIYEIRLGMRPVEQTRTEQFLSTMESIPVSDEISRMAAELGRPLVQSRKSIDPIDLLIAATCIVHHLTLVTFNRKHFKFPGLSLMPIDSIETPPK